MAGYVAYVGSYTNNKKKGIQFYDVDVDECVFTYKGEVDVHNPSYLIASHDKKFLYSIVDEGVSAFRIEEDGNLSFINTQ
jgi:6-phosphogluconolactonase